MGALTGKRDPRAALGIAEVPEDTGIEGLEDFLNQVRLRLMDIQSGKVAVAAGTQTGTGTPSPAPAPGPPGPPGPPPPPVAPDLTPPPTVSGAIVSAGLDFIFITTDAPIFSVGHGYDRTIVYGAQYGGTGPLPTFSDAVVLHEFRGQVGSFSREPATQWHIWLKWRTNDGVLSTSPEGGANGHQVTTGQDVSNLLESLTGQITTSQLFSSLNARIDLIDGNGAGSVNQRIDTGDTQLASQITTLSVSVGNNSAAIATEQSVRAAADGFVSAYYGLRTQVSQGGRTVVGGIGIMGTSGGSAGPTIDVGVVANKFYVTAPAGTTGVNDVLPFVIQTTDEVVNGVTIPKGVYMDAAYIKNLQAITARLGSAWITDAMIQSLSATKIKAGTISVGEYIQSADFVTGVSGWRWSGNTGEVGSTMIRGLLTATQIDTRGLDIRTPGGAVILSAAQNLDWARIGGFKPKFFRVDARGFSATGPVGTSMLVDENGTVIATCSRGYTIVLFQLSDGAVVFTREYDTYTEGTDPTVPGFGFGTAALAAELNAVPNTRAVVLFSADEPQSHRMDNGLPAAVYRCGGTPGVFGKANAVDPLPGFKVRSAYILVGTGNCGQGQGFEQYRGDLDNSTNSWCEMAFAIQLGRLLTSGTATPPLIDSTNITTYIAAAAIQNAQIANLSADKITTGSLVGQTITGGTFNGGVFQTATSGQRVVINEAGSNEARFYGNRGDGVIEELASIGINAGVTDTVIGLFGSANSSRVGIQAQSSTKVGVYGGTASGVAGVQGVSGGGAGSGSGVYGAATGNADGVAGSVNGSGVAGNFNANSGPGVRARSTTGYGVDAIGNSNGAPIRIEPLYSSPPADASDGALAMIASLSGRGHLCIARAGVWYIVGAWTPDGSGRFVEVAWNNNSY